MQPMDSFQVAILSATLDDIEQMRKSLKNRVRIMTTPIDQIDADGETRGFGLLDPMQQIELNISVMTEMTDALDTYEALAIKKLEKAMKVHPLGKWCSETVGIGYKQFGRFIGTVKDPYVNVYTGEPRTWSQLQAYCGLDVRAGLAPALKRGSQANWNGNARMRLWNIAGSCLKAKAKSPYGPVYDNARTKYADAIHEHDCKRCVAKAGEVLKPSHQHARAMRAVMKSILEDVYNESKKWHENMV